MNLITIKDRIAALLKDKSSGIQPEFQRQLMEILKRIEELLIDNHGECEIPDELIKEIAKCLMPDIIAYFESEKAQKEFAEWMTERREKERDTVENNSIPRRDN